jgi:gluconolactonase
MLKTFRLSLLLATVLCAAQAAEPTLPGIDRVIAAGTQAVLVRDGFDGTEGPLPQPDGGLLFTENRVGRIVRLAPDGTSSVFMDTTNGANALTMNRKGELIGALTAPVGVGVLRTGAAVQVLTKDFEGVPFARPNDITVNRRGQIWFTDTGNDRAAKAVYRLDPDGRLDRITGIALPNGVALSVDERTLYVANTAGGSVVAVTLDRRGAFGGQRDFAHLQLPPGGDASGADGLAIDREGRLFVATTTGVQIFARDGKPLGTLVLPVAPQNLAFSGPRRSVLYVVGRGAVYRIDTLTRGPDRPGK